MSEEQGFITVKLSDSSRAQKENAFFKHCEKHKIPFARVVEAKKYASLHADLITIDSEHMKFMSTDSSEAEMHTVIEEIIKKYCASRTPYTVGSVVTVEKVYIEHASKAMKLILDAIANILNH
ncbi:MAG: hypothetical protein RDU59_12770 [Thermodesulfobacteriota bacterium]|nr:hypothetical protein [Thermodesulfobacteriota bacterium]